MNKTIRTIALLSITGLFAGAAQAIDDWTSLTLESGVNVIMTVPLTPTPRMDLALGCGYEDDDVKIFLIDRTNSVMKNDVSATVISVDETNEVVITSTQDGIIMLTRKQLDEDVETDLPTQSYDVLLEKMKIGKEMIVLVSDREIGSVTMGGKYSLIGFTETLAEICSL